MTVEKLIALLRTMDPESQVLAYDANGMDYHALTGLLHRTESNEVYIQTDED